MKVLFLSNEHQKSGTPYNYRLEKLSEIPRQLSQAAALGLGRFRPMAEQAYQWVLSRQRRDGGSEFFSHGNYGWLTDRGAYPRNLAMVLYHLLLELGLRSAAGETNSDESFIERRACGL